MLWAKAAAAGGGNQRIRKKNDKNDHHGDGGKYRQNLKSRRETDIEASRAEQSRQMRL